MTARGLHGNKDTVIISAMGTSVVKFRVHYRKGKFKKKFKGKSFGGASGKVL